MNIRRLCVAALSILSAFYATAALAQSSPIGDAASVQNQVEGIVNRKAQPLSPGGSVFQNERVHTGDDSQAQLVFLDNTDLGVGPKSEVTLDRFVYNPDRGTGRVQIEASRGVFRFVTGSQDKKDYEIVTPSGTIHVKGTEFQLLVERGYIVVALESGALSITTNKGRVVALDQPGTSLTVHSDGRVEGPTPWKGRITKYANAPFPYFASAAPPAVNPLTLLASSMSWTGCSVGAAGGGSFPYLERGPSNAQTSATHSGASVSGLAGCSYQFGPVVVGAEGEYGYDGQSSNSTSFITAGIVPPSGRNVYVTQKFNVNGIGRTRAEFGYAVLPNILLYVASGWTFQSTNSSLNGMATGVSATSNKLINGENIGFGGEYAFTPFLIGRVEYIYDRFFPHYTYGLSGSAVASPNVKYNENTVRVAVQFKF